MGMDLYIFKARTRKVFETDNWYNSDAVTEMLYARKWWSLVEHCSFIPEDYESGDYIELTYDNIEEMIKVACEYPDYWDDYTNVPILCRMRDSFQEITEKGYHYYLEYDW